VADRGEVKARSDQQHDASVQVLADEHAVSFIQEHGGRLYVSLRAGLEAVGATAHEGIAYQHIEGPGFSLFVDEEIEAAHMWRLVYHRVPWPHVRALWNGAVFNPGGEYSHWEGGVPWKSE
jgi:hypothetical protein